MLAAYSASVPCVLASARADSAIDRVVGGFEQRQVALEVGRR